MPRMQRYVLPPSHLPTRLPIGLTFMAWFFLDRFHAPEWVWGVAGTIFALLWIVCIIMTFREIQKPLPNYGDQDTSVYRK